MKGTFWPTTIFASSLSRVRILGVDRILDLWSASSARASAARFSTVPPPGRVMVPRTTPMLRPAPTEVTSLAAPMILVPVLPQLVPPMTLVTSVGAGLNIGVVRGTITLPGGGTVLHLAALARALQADQRSHI